MTDLNETICDPPDEDETEELPETEPVKSSDAPS